MGISTHTPTRGVTVEGAGFDYYLLISTHTPTRGVTLYIVYKEPCHHHRLTFIRKIIRFCSYFINKLCVFSGEPAVFFISFQVRLLNYQYSLRIICFLCSIMLNTPLPIIPKIIKPDTVLRLIYQL